MKKLSISVSISSDSDECFDSMAFLQDLEDPISEEGLMVLPTLVAENLVEMEFFLGGEIDIISGGDFMDLKDLDDPISASDEWFDSMAFLQELGNQILEQNDASRKLNVCVSNKSEEGLMFPYTLGDGFMELDDLDNPMSASDEWFDTMAFLHDLKNQNLEQNDAAGRKLNVCVSEEMLMVSPTFGSVVSVEGSNSDSDEFFKTTAAVPNSISESRNQNNMVTELANGGEGSSSDSATAESDGQKTSSFGKMKNLRKKYSCFMPY